MLNESPAQFKAKISVQIKSDSSKNVKLNNSTSKLILNIVIQDTLTFLSK